MGCGMAEAVIVALWVGLLIGAASAAWIIVVLPAWLSEAVTVRHEMVGPATPAAIPAHCATDSTAP